jgi:hypothetical protein
LTEKLTKRQGLLHKCVKKECGFVEVIDPLAGKLPAQSGGEAVA